MVFLSTSHGGGHTAGGGLDAQAPRAGLAGTYRIQQHLSFRALFGVEMAQNADFGQVREASAVFSAAPKALEWPVKAGSSAGWP